MKQICLTLSEDSIRKLKAVRKLKGISISEIVRRNTDLYFESMKNEYDKVDIVNVMETTKTDNGMQGDENYARHTETYENNDNKRNT